MRFRGVDEGGSGLGQSHLRDTSAQTLKMIDKLPRLFNTPRDQTITITIEPNQSEGWKS